MKAKKQRKPAPDVAMEDMSEPKPRPNPRRAKKISSKAPKKLAKFKEEQHLEIETGDLREEEQGDAGSKAPPSLNKKRRRRAAEIDRKFRCPFGDCDKAYGSESSLNQHQKLKHPEEMAEAAAEAQETQPPTYPVHTRNVCIRPATPLVAFPSDPSLLLTEPSPTHLSEDLSITDADMAPPSAKAPRRNMRSRSNSEPVSLTDEFSAPIVPIPARTEVTFSIRVAGANSKKSRAKTPRKPRRAPTPHPKKVPAATTATASASAIRRAKLRSKSESLPEMHPFETLNELKMPPNHQNDRAASVHDPVLPLTAIDSGGRGSFEWPIPAASGHHSTSLSSDDQAIDSDILSVLANCDAEEVADPSVLDFAGPPSTSSFQSNTSFAESEDADMLPVGMECFKISENSTLPVETHGEFAMNEPEAELGLNAFATLGDDWHLSSHLEKMSVAQGDTPPGSVESVYGRLSANDGRAGRLRSASDPVHAAAPMHPAFNHFSSLPLESLAIKREATANPIILPAGDEMLQHNDNNYQQWFGGPEPTIAAKTVDTNVQPLLWVPTEAGIATVGDSQPSSQALDELLQHDDAVEWRTPNDFEGDSNSVGYALDDVGMAPSLL